MRQRKRLLNINPYCLYCGRKVDDTNSTLDHRHPKCMGGTSGKCGENLVLACKKCNSIKGNILPERWDEILPTLRQVGYLLMTKKQRREWRLANPNVLCGLGYGLRCGVTV